MMLWTGALLLLLSWLPLASLAATPGDSAHAADDQERAGDLARAVQNPVADLVSLPFQNNTNFGFGPREGTQNVLNVQPVIPMDLNDSWLLINRLIVPVVSQPALLPNQSRENGLGDTTYTAFLSPKDRERWIAGRWLWGAGPVVLLPTSTDDQLGPGEWGGGLSAVFLTMPGRWVVGSLFSNVWSFSHDTAAERINLFTWQPFVNYNLDGGWYLTTAPLVTANWEAQSSNAWTVPLGGGAGRVFMLGRQPVNVSLQGYYNVEKPDLVGPEWSLRLTLQLLFPR